MRGRAKRLHAPLMPAHPGARQTCKTDSQRERGNSFSRQSPTIVTHQRAGRPETFGQKRSPFLACVSMFSQSSEIFDFRLAREGIITQRWCFFLYNLVCLCYTFSKSLLRGREGRCGGRRLNHVTHDGGIPFAPGRRMTLFTGLSRRAASRAKPSIAMPWRRGTAQSASFPSMKSITGGPATG